MTYGTQSNGGSSQADQAAIAGMGLMDGIGKVVAQLLEDGRDPGVVSAGDQVADDALKPRRIRSEPGELHTGRGGPPEGESRMRGSVWAGEKGMMPGICGARERGWTHSRAPTLRLS